MARQETCDGRVIAHVDMDCFYVQGNITLPFCFNLRSEFSDILLYDVVCVCVVEQRKQPNLRGLPSAVIQYNSYKGGALIAVSYEARRCGVKRLLSTLPHYHAVHFIE